MTSPRPSLPISSIDLARDLGLSQSTISQVLAGRGRYSKETRERVIIRASELGYRPNASARSTRLRRHETIALITMQPTWKGQISDQLLVGMMGATRAAGLRLLIDQQTEADLGCLDQLPVIKRNLVDGLLVNFHLPPSPELSRMVAAYRMPTVWVHVRLPENGVHGDDFRATVALVDGLLQRGCRRLALLDYHHTLAFGTAGCHHSVQDRRAGFDTALWAAGLAPRLHIPEQRLDWDAQLAFTRALLRGATPPDAVICYSDRETALVFEAAAQLGKRVPQDLSVVQFGAAAAVATRPVATAIIPYAGIGAAAVQLLAERIADPDLHLPSVVVPFDFTWHATMRA